MHAFMMSIWALIANNPLIGLGIGAVVLLLFWKQPRQTMKLLFALLVLVALGYIVVGIIDFAMDSAVVKERMIDKNE